MGYQVIHESMVGGFNQNQKESYDLGKLEYFTNLNFAAIDGDDFPLKTNDFQGSGVRS